MLFRTLDSARDALDRPVVAIGNFDGVHRGHQAVFEQVLERAGADGVDSAALTFEPHPVQMFKPDADPFLLTTVEEKASRIADCGIDGTVALDFADIAVLTPEQFVDDVLHQGLNASCIIVGKDFKFGKGRAGDIDTLRELGAARGIDVQPITQVELDEEIISSTRIRAALRNANFETVTRLLGSPWALRGKVVHGDARGRDLGYPTANVETSPRLLPPDGIYATTIHAKGTTWKSATYVGTRPTFDGEGRNVEVFVLDAPEDGLDLYGESVSVAFIGHVRGDAKFESADALIEQMAKDVAEARRILGD
jgi:riboflavin kinase/FMN adenylyltransferase